MTRDAIINERAHELSVFYGTVLEQELMHRPMAFERVRLLGQGVAPARSSHVATHPTPTVAAEGVGLPVALLRLAAQLRRSTRSYAWVEKKNLG